MESEFDRKKVEDNLLDTLCKGLILLSVGVILPI